MTAVVIDVEVRSGNEKHARPDDHFSLNTPHPLEPMLVERAACAHHPNPEWWLVVSPKTRGKNAEAKRICVEECPVVNECREVADHVEASTSPLANPGSYIQDRLYTGVRAGEGPWQRKERRDRKRKSKKEGA